MTAAWYVIRLRVGLWLIHIGAWILGGRVDAVPPESVVRPRTGT